MITTIGRTDTPIDNIQFPTVTICPGEAVNSHRWAFTEEILNHIKFQCLDSQDNCTSTSILREDFQGFIGKTFDAFRDITRDLLHDLSYEELRSEFPSVSKDVNKIANISLLDLVASQNLLDEADKVFRVQLGKRGDHLKFFDVLDSMIEKQGYDPRGSEESDRAGCQFYTVDCHLFESIHLLKQVLDMRSTLLLNK